MKKEYRRTRGLIEVKLLHKQQVMYSACRSIFRTNWVPMSCDFYCSFTIEPLVNRIGDYQYCVCLKMDFNVCLVILSSAKSISVLLSAELSSSLQIAFCHVSVQYTSFCSISCFRWAYLYIKKQEDQKKRPPFNPQTTKWICFGPFLSGHNTARNPLKLQ